MVSDYQDLFDAMPHPYLVLRPGPIFEIVYVNDRYLAATGLSYPLIFSRPKTQPEVGVSLRRLSYDES